MMTKLKYALAFVWGAIFAACICFLAFYEKSAWLSFPATFVAISVLGLICLVVIFFWENWNT